MESVSSPKNFHGHRTVSLPCSEESYMRIIQDATKFRDWIDNSITDYPELFPPNIADGYKLKDSRVSSKQGLLIRRIQLRDGIMLSIRPSFVMPYMTARTRDVEDALFLRKFTVPFGHWPKSSAEIRCSGTASN